MYTNWEQDGSKQWDTFLSEELPDWLAANKGLAPNGHGVVGAAQGGYRALTLAAFHPDRYRFAGSLSGLPDPVLDRDQRRDHRRAGPASAASTPGTCGACHSSGAGSGMTPTCTCSC